MLEGLPPNNATHVMRLTTDQAEARRVADIMVETFDPADTAAAAFEAEWQADTWDSGPWIVEVYFGTAPDEAAVRALVAAAAGTDAAAAVSFARIGQQDWVAASLAGLAPVRAGRVLVLGGHDRRTARSNDITLVIEAALAFGTGHHGTTRGCLLMLDAIFKRRRPRRVLDIGTGTGVLALAAARRLHAPVACSDIDPVAVRTTRANAYANGASPWVRPVVARGVGHPTIRKNGPYDLIFANILAAPLRALAPGVATVAASNGDLVVSGLLKRDVPGVLDHYRAQRFRLLRHIDLDGWSTLQMAGPGRNF